MAIRLTVPLLDHFAALKDPRQRDCLEMGVSGGNRYLRERIIGRLESLSKAGAEGAIIDGAANLEQKIRPSP